MIHTYNWNISGHDRVIAGLEKELVEGNTSHAYLFAGSDNIGKYTAAKTLAHILQCENNYRHAAGGGATCSTCSEIEKGYHADTIELKDDGESIKIETVRDVLLKLHMSKQSPRRILLIKNIERMTLESANAMLKTLEDPPEGVMFLLTTSRIKEVLPTILSRVRTYNFQRLTSKNIADLLRENYPLAEPELLDQVISFSAGKPGKAISLMQNPELLDAARKMYNDIRIFVKKPDRASEFAYIAAVVKSAKDSEDSNGVRDFLDVFTAVLRQEMLERARGGGDTGRSAPLSGVAKIAELIVETQKAQDLLKRNVNNRLLLENLVLHL